MRQNEHKYQVGDVLYMHDRFSKETEEWTIEKIYFDEYCKDYGPIIYMTMSAPEGGRKNGQEFRLDDLLCYCFDTREEAEEEN